jgi:hypothetical protein
VKRWSIAHEKSAGAAQMDGAHLHRDNGAVDAPHHVQANGHSARACEMTMHYDREERLFAANRITCT